MDIVKEGRYYKLPLNEQEQAERDGAPYTADFDPHELADPELQARLDQQRQTKQAAEEKEREQAEREIADFRGIFEIVTTADFRTMTGCRYFWGAPGDAMLGPKRAFAWFQWGDSGNWIVVRDTSRSFAIVPEKDTNSYTKEGQKVGITGDRLMTELSICLVAYEEGQRRIDEEFGQKVQREREEEEQKRAALEDAKACEREMDAQMQAAKAKLWPWPKDSFGNAIGLTVYRWSWQTGTGANGEPYSDGGWCLDDMADERGFAQFLAENGQPFRKLKLTPEGNHYVVEEQTWFSPDDVPVTLKRDETIAYEGIERAHVPGLGQVHRHVRPEELAEAGVNPSWATEVVDTLPIAWVRERVDLEADRRRRRDK